MLAPVPSVMAQELHSKLTRLVEVAKAAHPGKETEVVIIARAFDGSITRISLLSSGGVHLSPTHTPQLEAMILSKANIDIADYPDTGEMPWPEFAAWVAVLDISILTQVTYEAPQLKYFYGVCGDKPDFFVEVLANELT